jgi:hypothetical protein
MPNELPDSFVTAEATPYNTFHIAYFDITRTGVTSETAPISVFTVRAVGRCLLLCYADAFITTNTYEQVRQLFMLVWLVRHVPAQCSYVFNYLPVPENMDELMSCACLPGCMQGPYQMYTSLATTSTHPTVVVSGIRNHLDRADATVSDVHNHLAFFAEALLVSAVDLFAISHQYGHLICHSHLASIHSGQTSHLPCHSSPVLSFPCSMLSGASLQALDRRPLASLEGCKVACVLCVPACR